MITYKPLMPWLPLDRRCSEAKCIWATGVLLWQPGMTFICVGGSHVAEPLTALQLMRICRFVEEHFLANLDFFLCYPSKFRKKPINERWEMRNEVRYLIWLTNRPGFGLFRRQHPNFLNAHHRSINGNTKGVEIVLHGLIHIEEGGNAPRVKEDKPCC